MNKPIPFKSQAGQDRWVLEMLLPDHLDQPRSGSFLEIGCNDPISLSNTYALEYCGWSGFMFDNDPNCIRDCRAKRSKRTIVIEADVTKFPWQDFAAKSFDYLSLDVDSATLATLRVLLAAGITFRVATIEHDSYRFGPGPRDAMRELLTKAGYVLFVADVSHTGLVFEDWWVEPALKDTKVDLSFVERGGAAT